MAINPQEMLRRLAMMNQGQVQQPQANITLPTPPAQDWQQHMATLSALRERNPAASPVPVGTPTLSKLQMEEETRRADRQFEADERYRAQQLALQRLRAAASGGAGGGGLPADDPTQYREIQSELKQLVDYYANLIEPAAEGRIQRPSTPGFTPSLDKLREISAQPQPPKPKYTQEQAIEEAVKTLLAQNPKLGLTTKQISETIDWIYGVYGLPREKKETKPDMTLQQILNAYGDGIGPLTAEQAQAMIDKWYPESGINLLK